jgi:hypothetical protein
MPTKWKLCVIHYQCWKSNYVHIHEKKKITKLQKPNHNMNQFINRNNVYGSKVVHTITKISLIIPSSSMAWKKKIDTWWPLRIRVKVENIGLLIMCNQEYTQTIFSNNVFKIIFRFYANKEKTNKWPPRMRFKVFKKGSSTTTI